MSLKLIYFVKELNRGARDKFRTTNRVPDNDMIIRV